jgi:hypothetical protein
LRLNPGQATGATLGGELPSLCGLQATGEGNYYKKLVLLQQSLAYLKVAYGLINSYNRSNLFLLLLCNSTS